MSEGDEGTGTQPDSPSGPKPTKPDAANPFLAADQADGGSDVWLEPDDDASAPAPPAPTPPGEAAQPPAAPAAPRSAPAAPRSASPKRSRAKVIAFVLVPVLALAGGLAYQAQLKARPEKTEPAAVKPSAETTERVEPPTSIPEPPPPPTHRTEPPPSASASTAKKVAAASADPAPALSADPATTGLLDTTALPAGRKVIVDGRYVGTSPRRIVVRCGMRRIQIGELPVETLNLPCGGEITFTD